MKNKMLIVTLFSLVLTGCSLGNSRNSQSSSALETSSTQESTTTQESSIIDEESSIVQETSSTPETSSSSNRATYTVTFKADGEVVDTITYYEGDTSLTEPSVPEKAGYSGEWEEYSLNDTNIEVEAVYTAITYTATFMDDTVEVGKVEYTIENYEEKEAPEVPAKDHYIGRWSPEVDFSVLEDRTYYAVYDLDVNVKHGSFKYENEKYIATSDNSIAISDTLTMSNGTLSANMMKSSSMEDSGIVFGVTYKEAELNEYWEKDGVSYYYFFVNINNGAYLAKSDNGQWKQLGRVEGILNFNEETEYPLSVSFENGYIRCFVGDECLIKYEDSNPLTGTGVGYRAQKQGTYYSALTVSNEIKKDTKDVVEGHTVAHGSAILESGNIKTTSGNTIVIDNDLRMEEGKVYTTSYKSGVRQDGGIIIGLKDEGYRSFWEEGWTSMEYYFFFINFDGILILSKVGSTTGEGVWNTVADNNNIKDFDPTKTYNLGVEVVGTTLKCYVDGMLVHTYNTGRQIVGNMLGYRAAQAGALYGGFTSKAKDNTEIEWYQRSGSFVKGEDGSLTSYCDGSLAWANNKSLTKGSFQVDITASQASDTGIVFGCSDPVAARWEERPYYFFFVNGGNAALLAGPVNGWTTFKDGGNVTEFMNPYGTPNTFKVEIKDEYNIVCSVNGHEVINVTLTEDSHKLTGTYFGVRCVGQGMRKFSNFVITNAE